MRTFIFLFSMLIMQLTVPTGALMAANGDIEFTSKAETEVRQVNAEGVSVLVRQPASLVLPGTIVIYTNSFANKGKELAENLVVSNPIPEGVEFLAGSALPESAKITYSIDNGSSFGTPDELLITAADGSKRPAEAKDYTNIRWMLTSPLKPGEQGQVEYRALLE